MDIYEEKLKKYISQNTIEAQHFVFEESCHTVEEAAKAVNASINDLIKSICFIDLKGNLITAVVKGEDRVSTTRIGEALGIERPRSASPDEILNKIGYPVGGIPPFGYSAIFLIDPKVMEKDFVYAGGGSENSLTKISSSELQRANKGKVVRVRK